jgi:hypothetical protein
MDFPDRRELGWLPGPTGVDERRPVGQHAGGRLGRRPACSATFAKEGADS